LVLEAHISQTPAPPQAIDPIAKFFNTVISGLTTGLGAPVVEAAAEVEVPFLAEPIIKQLFEALVNYFAGKLSIVEQQGALQLVFAVEEGTKLYDLGQAMLALQQARAGGNPDAISAAQQNAVNQWGSAIHFSGIAPVQN
jgi:hypothetical protein